ncbi:MAG TPA: glycosyltransferase [Deltaproteobacteria bacterium]|nr:glycosyltransferase [Deltaproteobacteria bacterium]HOI08178.1 glycosyltransferase [Deltaproteobacteria bacterium]
MGSTRVFSTGLRDAVREKIERLGHADIVIGIPSYHSDGTIRHVIETVRTGLDTYYHDARAVIMISDGGSTDDTREAAGSVDEKSFNIEKIVAIYRGLPGKGSALRAVFEVASILRPKAVAVFDSDLVSITPQWIKNLIEPVMEGHDFVAPDYLRYKFDATITNTIAYNLVCSLYGVRIRQPIGGDFGLSLRLVKHYLAQDEVWGTDVSRFGIDIWMTATAVVGGFNICQARLGVKVHDHKDPTEDLGPMYRQVVGTIFQLMEMHEDHWKGTRGLKDVPVLGEYPADEPAPFEINQEDLIEYFKMGFWNFNGVWQQILEKKDMAVIKALAHDGRREDFLLPLKTWVRTVYRYANSFHITPRQRMKLLNTMIPLYYARVASLVNELRDKDCLQAEAIFDEQAKSFGDMKDYLIKLWK